MIRKRYLAAALAAPLLSASPALAAIRLAIPFGEHMVLQQGIPVPIWGTATGGGEWITVRFAGQSVFTIADADGKWTAWLAPLKAGGPYDMTISENWFSLRLNDVLVGEVWLVAGGWSMGRVAKEAEEIPTTRSPFVRIFKVKAGLSDDPQAVVGGKWAVTSSENPGDFSASAYFFGRELYSDLKVPIGLIESSYEGSSAQAWTSCKALAANPDLHFLLDNYEKAKNKFGPAARDQKAPCLLYNSMIAPLAPYGMRGATWYQDQSCHYTASQYRSIVETLIQDWRRTWGPVDLSFLFVQLGGQGTPPQDPNTPSELALIREAQLRGLSAPDSGMATTIDLGAENKNPKESQELGRRLGLVARALTYNEPVAYSGPVYEMMNVEGSVVRLRFSHTEGGLTAHGGKLGGFAIAGQDRKFVWADANIERDTVAVSSPQVTKPLAVRYAWADNPVVSLFNGAGLPAAPFRTDNW